MKTIVYYVRHAQPNYNNHNDLTRELTPKGLEDRKLVTEFFENVNVDVILSSPYHRSYDTIKEMADSKGLTISVVDDFRERKIESTWIDDFDSFCKSQWSDFNYKLSEGESLGEVQKRNINALEKAIEKFKGKTIVVGSHGTALSTIINYFDKSFGYYEFEEIRGLMPWIVKFTFENDNCVDISKYNLFE